MVQRFRLLVSSLPIVGLVLLVRWLLRDVWEIGEVASFGEVGSVITGVTLILGFMLGGVLADYKESEKLPATVAGALSGLATTASMGLHAKDQDSTWARQRVSLCADAILEWLHGRTTDSQMWAAHADMANLINDVERAGIPGHYMGRLLNVNGELASTLNRIAVIRNTSFVQSGYVLMMFLVAVLQVSLAVVSFPSTVMSWIAPAVLSTAYAYLMLLVRDLDNPFGHGENNGKGSGADVDLAPLVSAAAQLRS